ncbi:ATP12 family protein [Pleurotus pulmonarius]
MLRSSLQLCSTRRAPIRSQALRCMRWNSALGAATTRPDGPVLSETNRAEATLKRFWKTVGIDKHGDSLAVTLDKRALKTPSGNTLLLPQNKRLVATLIAGEWDSQETMLKPHALPMTSIASRALDAMSDEKTRHDVRDALLNYLDTDTICFHQEEPPLLAELQSEHWTSESILLSEQPEETKRKLGAVLDTFDPWEMAAMERATYTTKSFLIALALVKKQLSIEQAAKAAQIEVDSQIQRWGEVEDSHDVDFHDVRRQLGSAACLLSYT